MKRVVVGFIGVLILGMAGLASAIPFDNVVDFDGPGNHTYTTISDSSDNYVGLYTHTVTFDPAAVSVQSATLSLVFSSANKLQGKNNEVWWVSASNNVLLGKLTGPNNVWTTQDFILPVSLFSAVSGSSWTIGFKFNETTDASDSFCLDMSKLFGEYTAQANGTAPVPEPGTLLLLGSGLVGLVVTKRKSSKR